MLVERESGECSFHATTDFSRTSMVCARSHIARRTILEPYFADVLIFSATSITQRQGAAHMEQSRIDEIAKRLLGKVPQAARNIQADLEENFRAVLRASLSRLDLVSRDEFAVQSKVLERTRARLEALEARVQELEAARIGRSA
jgi:ubiquinone biosynthesis accessory factor UbiK